MRFLHRIRLEPLMEMPRPDCHIKTLVQVLSNYVSWVGKCIYSNVGLLGHLDVAQD